MFYVWDLHYRVVQFWATRLCFTILSKVVKLFQSQTILFFTGDLVPIISEAACKLFFVFKILGVFSR